MNDLTLLEDVSGKSDIMVFSYKFKEPVLFIHDLLMRGSIALSVFPTLISTNNSVTLLGFRATDTKGNTIHQSTFHGQCVPDCVFDGQIAKSVGDAELVEFG